MEGIVSFGLVLMVAATFFPLMSNMLHQINESKKEMNAYRLMYEQTEKLQDLEALGSDKLTWLQTEFTIIMEKTQKGDWIVCAQYEEKSHCVE